MSFSNINLPDRIGDHLEVPSNNATDQDNEIRRNSDLSDLTNTRDQPNNRIQFHQSLFLPSQSPSPYSTSNSNLGQIQSPSQNQSVDKLRSSKANSGKNTPRIQKSSSSSSLTSVSSKASKRSNMSGGFSNAQLSHPAHVFSWSDLEKLLESNVEDGLTTTEASNRLELYGPNELGTENGVHIWRIILRQAANAMTLVLIIAMTVSFAIRSWIEGGATTLVILLNIVIGTWQEYSAEKTMDGLRNLSSPTANVIRDGRNFTIPTREVTIGDIVELKVGDTIPADIRFIETVNFETDEASLTGESISSKKDSKIKLEVNTDVGDRINTGFSVSTVTKGRAKGIVFAIGKNTQIGIIAESLRGTNQNIRPVRQSKSGKIRPHWYIEAWIGTGWDFLLSFLGINVGTPLYQKLSKLAILLFGVAVLFAGVVLLANLSHVSNPEVIIYAVATGLSMIPASLVVVLAITTGNGTREMSKRNVIVRNNRSLESLGSVTDICSDKTGTITQGKMIVSRIWLPSPNGGTIIVNSKGNAFNPTVGELKWSKNKPLDVNDEATALFDIQKEMNQKDDLKRLQLKEYLNITSLANLAVVHPVHDDDKTKNQNHNNNSNNKEQEWVARGDPTEIAMQVFSTRFDWNKSKLTNSNNGKKPLWKQITEYDFSSDIKRMSVVYKNNLTKKRWIFTKGAVERILDRCIFIHDESEFEPSKLTAEHKKDILKQMDHLASLGLRTLAVASRIYEDDNVDEFTEDMREEVESKLVFRGLVGIYDPPRLESAISVQRCHEAGIVVHMLTGDHAATATAIAKDVGILPKNTENFSQDVLKSMIMTAQDFDGLNDDEIDKLPFLPLVVARCAPHTKVRMIEALHRRARFVAMTGDGVNDAPSLNKADVGIAMGQGGSDVAKDASDIILSDDNFASILNGIEEGRRMFENIQKFVLHLLAQNVAQALVLLIGLVFKDDVNQSVFPISPVQIMWIIMITSSFPDMGLGKEKASPNILKEPPKDFKIGVFTKEIILDIIIYGIWIAALTLGSFISVLYMSDGKLIGNDCNATYSLDCRGVFQARATAFACLTFFSVFLAWQLIDLRKSLFLLGKERGQWFGQVLWRNKFLFISVFAGFFTIFPVLYIPVINRRVFKHEGITWEWIVVIIATILFFMGIELWKYGKRVYFKRVSKKKELKDTEENTGKDGHEDLENNNEEEKILKSMGYKR